MPNFLSLETNWYKNSVTLLLVLPNYILSLLLYIWTLFPTALNIFQSLFINTPPAVNTYQNCHDTQS